MRRGHTYLGLGPLLDRALEAVAPSAPLRTGPQLYNINCWKLQLLLTCLLLVCLK